MTRVTGERLRRYIEVALNKSLVTEEAVSFARATNNLKIIALKDCDDEYDIMVCEQSLKEDQDEL
jgi:hypothetical protein